MTKKSVFDGRDFEKDYAEIVPIPKEIKDRAKKAGYDKCLKIVLHGDPFSDSRPRINKITGGVVLVNIEKMKVIFNLLYNKSELLQNLTIMSPFHMYIKFYMRPTQEDLKYFRKNPRMQRLFERESIFCLARQDVDNMCKIHNDILFVDDRFITLTDSFNVGFYDPEKYLSPNPRAEVYVLYTDGKILPYYKNYIEKTSDYQDYIHSIKNMKQNNRTVEEQFKHIRKILQTNLKECNGKEVKIRKVLGDLCTRLEKYPAQLIKDLADLDPETASKFNKLNAVYKLMLLLSKGNPIAVEIIKRGGKLLT